jgi:crotonobetainyl-CoA:carnitine CoA-transferase CaiB-like acyl-CoA transferase
MGWAVSNYLICGVEPGRWVDQNATAARPGRSTPRTGRSTSRPTGRSSSRRCAGSSARRPARDPRFAEREARKRHRPSSTASCNQRLRAGPPPSGSGCSSAAGVPAARILTVPEALASEQLAHREFLADVPFPANAVDRSMRVAGNGVLVDGDQLRPTAPPPHSASTTPRCAS